VSEPLSAIDELFFRGDSPTTHQGIASLCLLDSIPDFEALQRRLPAFLERFPRLKQRVKDGATPRWETVVGFDASLQLQLIIDSSITSQEALLMVASRTFSQALALDRPLWRFSVIVNRSPEPNNTTSTFAAILFMIHHSMSDGIGALEMIDYFCGSSREKSLASTPERHKSRAADKSAKSDKSAGTLIQVGLFRRSASLVKWLAEFLILPAQTLLNGKNSARRVASVINFPLVDLRDIKKQAGTSANDVVLALVSDAVRRYHQLANRTVGRLRVAVPVSLRSGSARHQLGNQLSAVGVQLPSAEEDSLSRLLRISAYFSELKQSGSLGTYAHFGELIAKLPRFCHKFFIDLQARRTNFICSNMPNSMRPRFVGGALIEANYGMPALLRGHGVAFGFMSYSGNLCTVIVSDPQIVPHPEILINCLQQSADELIEKVKHQALSSAA